MQPSPQISQAEAVREIVSELNAILPSVPESKARLTLLTCMEKLDRLGSRSQVDAERMRRECESLRALAREQGAELKSLRRRHRKDEESIKNSEVRACEEMQRLRRRLSDNEEQLRALKDSRRFKEQQTLLRDNQHLREELARASNKALPETPCDAAMSQLQSAHHQISDLTNRLKEVAFKDKEYEFLQEDYRILQEELHRKDKYISELETTVIDQSSILSENERDLRKYAAMALRREESCRTEETCESYLSGDPYEYCGEPQEKEEKERAASGRRRRNRKRSSKKHQSITCTTNNQSETETETPTLQLPMVTPSPTPQQLPSNAKALLLGFVLSIMMLLGL